MDFYNFKTAFNDKANTNNKNLKDKFTKFIQEMNAETKFFKNIILNSKMDFSFELKLT